MTAENSSIADPLVAFEQRTGDIGAPLRRLYSLSKGDRDTFAAREVYQLLVDEAERGSAFAMCLCSRLSLDGWGTEKSAAVSFAWASRAAASNYAPAYFELGRHFEQGIGVAIDLDRARTLYDQAVNSGFGFAAYHLALANCKGTLGEKNIASAFRYAEIAADLGESFGAALLAWWYEEGDGVERDEAAAVRWHEKAVQLGNFYSAFHLGMAYALGRLGLPIDKEESERYLALSEVLSEKAGRLPE